MAFLNYEFKNLQDLLVYELQDLYDAEQRLVDALPKMAQAANAPDLKDAYSEHLQQTQGHVNRLEEIFTRLALEPQRETCQAMTGLIKEGQDMISAKGDPATHDAALIAAAQRIEHYEIAAYGSARTFAQQLGRSDIADILQQTLDEESTADRHLTEIAEGHVNAEAQLS